MAIATRWEVEIPRTGPGDTVVILDPGQRGLASVVACRAAGAEKILANGLSADAKKLTLAREFRCRRHARRRARGREGAIGVTRSGYAKAIRLL